MRTRPGISLPRNGVCLPWLASSAAVTVQRADGSKMQMSAVWPTSMRPQGSLEYARRFGSDPGDGLTDHVGAVAMFHGPFQGERQEQFQSGGARGGFAERQEFFIVIDRRVVRADGVDRAIEQALRDGFTVFT